MRKIFFCLLAFSAILAGCTDEAKPVERSGSDSETYFLDYQVTAEEGGEIVTCKFQFRDGGAEADPVNLADSGSVALDGEVMQPDSSRFNGYYYETVRYIEDFRGDHAIEFTGPDGKKFTEEFSFMPFSLAEEIPAQIKKEGFVIRLKNFPEKRTPIRLVMTDTSFGSSWINKAIAVTGAEIHITPEMLSRLKPGPVGLELYREERLRFDNPTERGGRFVINYSLKRDLELVE